MPPSEPSSSTTTVQTCIPPHAMLRHGVAGLLWMGRDALGHGDLDEATAWFQMASSARPDQAMPALALGACLAEAGRLEDAFVALTSAVEADPDDPVCWHQWARVAARTGRHVDALRVLGSLCASRPELAASFREDEAFGDLRDHPWFVTIVGDA